MIEPYIETKPCLINNSLKLWLKKEQKKTLSALILLYVARLWQLPTIMTTTKKKANTECLFKRASPELEQSTHSHVVSWGCRTEYDIYIFKSHSHISVILCLILYEESIPIDLIRLIFHNKTVFTLIYGHHTWLHLYPNMESLCRLNNWQNMFNPTTIYTFKMYLHIKRALIYILSFSKGVKKKMFGYKNIVSSIMAPICLVTR